MFSPDEDFPSRLLGSQCLFLHPGCHNACENLLPLKRTAKAPINFCGNSINPKLPPRDLWVCFDAYSAQNVGTLQVSIWEILTSLMQRARVGDVATAGGSYQQNGCGRPDMKYLIHFSIKFAEPWNKLMISKWNFSFASAENWKMAKGRKRDILFPLLDCNSLPSARSISFLLEMESASGFHGNLSCWRLAGSVNPQFISLPGFNNGD